jgi:hypothetical protein
MNEKTWNIALRDGFLHVTSPGRKRAKIRMTTVIGIAIESNQSGPWGSNIIWHVSDGKFSLHFPVGATGEPEILEAFQQLPGFDNQAVANARACTTSNEIFVAYKKGR